VKKKLLLFMRLWSKQRRSKQSTWEEWCFRIF